MTWGDPQDCMSRKLEPQSKYFKNIQVVLNCAPFVLICAENDFLENPKLRPKLIKTLFFTRTATYYYRKTKGCAR